ncbi:family 10 glycosylhydrolase [Candidatus Sumerlaeota bacterium]|nr:family 10 glycosylhydrolase [Candidatus Sumerlaeota bacterium]
MADNVATTTRRGKNGEKRRYLIPETRGLRYEFDTTIPLSKQAERLSELRERGYNLLVVNGLEEGYTIYPSEVMHAQGFPAIHPFQRRHRDMFQQVIEIASRLDFHIYLRASLTKLLARNRFRAHPVISKQPSWSVCDHAGRRMFAAQHPQLNFLCPANPEVRRHLGAVLSEMIVGQPVSGVMLADVGFPLRSAYPDTAACFCESCKRQVDQELAINLAEIELDPADAAYQRWTEWRTERVGAFVASLRSRIQSVRPDLIIGLQFYGGLGPDSKHPGTLLAVREWLEEGLLDLAAPVYMPRIADDFWLDMPNDVERLPANTLILPTLRDLPMENAREMIQLIKELPLCGFLLDPGMPLTEEVKEQLRSMGVIGQARAVEFELDKALIDILYAAMQLLPRDHSLYLLLKDMSRLLNENFQEGGSRAALNNLISNFAGLEERLENGQLQLPIDLTPVARHLNLARRIVEMLTSGRSNCEANF